MEKISHKQYTQEGWNICIFIKVYFKIKNTPNKIGHFIMINENIIIINVYEVNKIILKKQN